MNHLCQFRYWDSVTSLSARTTLQYGLQLDVSLPLFYSSPNHSVSSLLLLSLSRAVLSSDILNSPIKFSHFSTFSTSFLFSHCQGQAWVCSFHQYSSNWYLLNWVDLLMCAYEIGFIEMASCSSVICRGSVTCPYLFPYFLYAFYQGCFGCHRMHWTN